MGRARLGVLGVLCLLLASCASDEVPVAQDLTTLRRAYADGRIVPVVADPAGAQRSLRAEQPGPIDAWVRVPDAAALQYASPPGPPTTPISVGLALAGAATPIAPAQATNGSSRVPLGDGHGAIAKLTLAPATADPLRLVAPRIEGRAQRVPPILPVVTRPGRPPNVILYVVDTLRRDRLSLYGYGKPTSPSLEDLARHAVVFDNAYAEGSFTSPSVTSLLSSRHPDELLGVLDPSGPATVTLAEAFRAAGYATAGFQVNVLCTPELGFARGFDDYQLLGAATVDGLAKVPAAELHAAALGWVRAHRDQPFFLYLQSMDVHFPYVPPSPFRDLFVKEPTAEEAAVLATLRATLDEEKLRVFLDRIGNMSPARYDGAISYADHEIGVLFEHLRRLGLGDDTIVVVTADHGEPLGDRGEMLHGRSLFEELVHVPLILWLPGADGGGRVEEIVSHLDLGPTLLDLAGIAPPPSFLGRSWLRPGTVMRPPGAVGELPGPAQQPAAWFAREGPWKLLLDATGGVKLFHLPSDPGETQDVSAAYPDVTGYLVMRATARPDIPAPQGGLPQALQRLNQVEQRRRTEALRALGYVD